MNPSVQRVLRRITKVARPLALRSAGGSGSNTSVIRHVGRRTGRTYDTPVVAVEHGDDVFIALPYGEHSDWVRNVVASGHATIVSHGRTFEVDRPQIVTMAEATAYFRPKEQRMQRRFGVDQCVRAHRLAS